MSYDRRPLKSRSFTTVQSVAKKLAERGIKPNTISLAGIGFAIAGFVCMWGAGRGWPFGWFFLLLAAVTVQCRLMCNLLDGIVAVEFDLREKGGDLFNEVPDRVEDALFLVGAGYAAQELELGWLCAILAVFTAYVRAFGASLGQSQDFGGPCAKQHRMALLTLGLLAAAVVYFVSPTEANMHLTVRIVLWIIAAGTAVTAFLRIRRLYQKLP
jgi:phosphatidylglycerophosphate synthase